MNESAPSRTRTIRWTDPSTFTGPFRQMDGLAIMRGFQNGELPSPPFMDLLGVRIVAVAPGAVSFEYVPAEFMYSPLGTVHGGLLTVLLDTAMGCSFHTSLRPGVGYTTIELKVNFLRPVTVETGPIRADGRVVHAGARIGTAEARLTDREGRLLAHATSTLMVLRAEPDAPSAPR